MRAIVLILEIILSLVPSFLKSYKSKTTKSIEELEQRVQALEDVIKK